MRYPWANILLIVLVAAELITGYLGLIHSNPEWIAAMHLHRIFGFTILALFIWKSRNILGSVRSAHNWHTSGRAMLWSIILLVGLLTVLGLGLAWSHFGYYSWLGFSGVTIHMNLALLLLPLLIAHALRHRISWRVRYVADRRNALRVGGLAVAGFILWRTSEFTNVLTAGPGASRRYTGSHPEDGDDFPVTMWLNDKIPNMDTDRWRLRVDGHVEHPYELDLAELQGWRHRMTATLDCTGGWYTTREWEGVLVSELLDRAQPKPGAGSITIRSRTGYFRRYSLREAGRAILASRVNGAPLAPRPRLSGADGRATQARLRLGEVGGLHYGERYWQVLATAAATDVRARGQSEAGFLGWAGDLGNRTNLVDTISYDFTLTPTLSHQRRGGESVIYPNPVNYDMPSFRP